MTVQLTFLLCSSICIVFVFTAEISPSIEYSPLLEAGNLKNFPLRKCHCGENKFWENGACKRATTSVNFFISFPPSIQVLTSDIGDIFVSNVVCEDATPVQMNNVALNLSEHNSIFHFDSGDSFHKYCIEHIKNDAGDIVMIAAVCIPTLNVPVCCPEGYSIQSKSLECIKRKNVTINPPIHIGTGGSIPPNINISPYLQTIPNCNQASVQKKPLYSDSGKTKGSLHYQKKEVHFVEWDFSEYPLPLDTKFPEDFCVDAEISANPTYSVYIWNESAHELCRNSSRADSFDGLISRCDDIMYWALLPLLVLSSACLVVILVLHAMLPELRITIGSKITLAHVASLLSGFLVLLLLHMPIDFNCKIYGPIIQGCFLATFFWLNVMCFDLWSKLRCTCPAGDDGQQTKKKFRKYTIYAWGSPLLIVIVTVILDNVEGLEDYPYIIVPGFGRPSCWFKDPAATMAYYFGIIAVLMVVNVILFVWVFVILVRANYTYNQVLRNDVRSSRRTWIYLKIFGVMGITWIFEFFSWHEGSCTYWIVTDVINSLRGLILLIIFFGNKKSWNKINKRFSDLSVRVNVTVTQSMSSLRKLSLRPMYTAESTVEPIRTLDSISEGGSKRANIHQNEVSDKEVRNGTS